MNTNLNFLCLILICSLLLINCNDNNEPTNELESEIFLCCGDNPFTSENIDNLDQTAGEITVFPYSTSNGDSVNDYFRVDNLEFYPNNTLTIFDLEDNIVYTASNYNQQDFSLFFPNNNEVSNGTISIGTYKYKIIVENEQTFVESGYFCLFENDTSFVNGLIECGNGIFDPVVTN
tara:strand:- start:83 stop:610 length:528 start_codon:yes stop_codon:yes gene_type:complete